MTVEEAVTAWKNHMEPFKGKATLVSPAVTNGAAPMGLDWLDRFIKQCNGCTIDAVAIHIYNDAGNIAYFKDYINKAAKKYKKPVWVTEVRVLFVLLA